MGEILAVEAQNLSVHFGDFKAVHNITFSVRQGEIFGFLGANGAGKTTTIRVLCGLLLPTFGKVRLAGIEFENEKAIFSIKSRVGYMSQKFTLYDDLTVGENLDFTASLRKIPRPLFKTRKRELLQLIDFAQSERSLVRELSGGIKQQVSLVAALLHDPEIVFLDEPTAGVTPASRALFWQLIRHLAGQGKTVFVTTHYMDEAEQCDRIALMRAGEIIALDSPLGLKKNSFPYPLMEVSSRSGLPVESATIDLLRKLPVTKSISPYGRKYHAIVTDMEEWNRQLPAISGGLQTRAIEPSLEDVFIYLVEGANR